MAAAIEQSKEHPQGVAGDYSGAVGRWCEQVRPVVVAGRRNTMLLINFDQLLA